MSIHFHSLTVKEVRKETADCVSILLDVPADLRSRFKYDHGQSVTVRAQIEGTEVRRTYSLCSSPLENEWRIAVKKVDGGLFSSFANEKLRKGDVLEVMPPIGKFNTNLKATARRRYVAFAAGSGITPVLSLIKTTLATEPESTFTLVFGNRTRQHIIFFEELEAIKNKYIHRFNLIHILSKERMETSLNSGRIDADKMAELSGVIDYAGVDEFFLCGPQEMIFSIKGYLESLDVSKEKIHFELFTTPGQKRGVKTQRVATEDTGPRSTITIKLDGRSLDITMPANSEESILDVALQHGADLPFACKGGVCCTCKARLIHGEVSMDVHWGLEDEEVRQGFILTCQSHPKTAEVVVDFDVK